MSGQQALVVASVLANDEVSTDTELREYFLTEIGLTEAEADKAMAQRSAMLCAFFPPMEMERA